ncbi:hypothetical protein HRbin34_00096 [bacterium HR34]|mgnify:CR=1 FL=1|nr:hypothetical protein HRbin34_00096 [bacterium HR34]
MHRKKDKKFYIKTRNGEAIILYNIENGKINAYHTFVPESEMGKGLVSKFAVVF